MSLADSSSSGLVTPELRESILSTGGVGALVVAVVLLVLVQLMVMRMTATHAIQKPVFLMSTYILYNKYDTKSINHPRKRYCLEIMTRVAVKVSPSVVPMTRTESLTLTGCAAP